MTVPTEPPVIDRGLDDAAVVARVIAGDVQCFAEIVDRYQAALYRHAVSIVLDHDVAADMAQDAFIRAYTNLAACRDRMRFKAWLFQVLRNRCFDYLKEARRKTVSLESSAVLVDRAEGPDARIARMRLRQQILTALTALSPPQREAFLMHYVEGIPYEAMAELLDASVSALKMRVLRAREALGAALQDGEVTNSRPARLSARRG